MGGGFGDGVGFPVSTHPPRRNQDTSRPNAYGKALVELCRNTCVGIANGRSAGDVDGAVTYDRGSECH